MDFWGLATEVERPLGIGVLWFRARFIPYTDAWPLSRPMVRIEPAILAIALLRAEC